MIPAEIIIRKRNGHELSAQEIGFFIEGFTRNTIPDYQMAALAMAIFFRGMTPAETATLVRCMMESGETYDLDDLGLPLVDKHSTGGVGDKISLILAPLAAACGLGVPMVSGRGLGHTGGTLDKLESIPGFRVGLDRDAFREGVRRVGVCMIGQTDSFVPADKKLYALRDVTGTVESIPLITGSILSKKLASGARALVMDVKYGSGAFMDTLEKARALADALEAAGAAMGTPVRCVLSDMGAPLGAAVGNTLEVLESLDLLRGSGPADVRDLTLRLTAEMLVLGRVADSLDEATALATRKLDDGSAMVVFRRMVEYQGGDVSVCDGPTLGWSGPAANGQSRLDLDHIHAGSMSLASGRLVVRAHAHATIAAIDTRAVGMAGIELGAGRLRSDEGIDHGVGILCHVRPGQVVKSGDALFTLIHREGRGVTAAEARLRAALATA
jgi:pyrimidine-nucleoside phosphorylase